MRSRSGWFFGLFVALMLSSRGLAGPEQDIDTICATQVDCANSQHMAGPQSRSEEPKLSYLQMIAAPSQGSGLFAPDPMAKTCSQMSSPIFENRSLCIHAGAPRGSVEVEMFGISTIDERNRWINEIGQWLQVRGIDPCGQTTLYLTNAESVRPPLYKQTKGIPGEKAFLMFGGLWKPAFCPDACNFRNMHLDRQSGRCV